MTWVQTYTGKAFWPLEPRVEDVDIHDIARALSQKCRYNGHTTRFYSVAEHSVLLSSCFAGFTQRRQALLHDAAEAYLPDVARPIKAKLIGFAEIEERVEKVIFEAFDVPWPVHPDVKTYDARIVSDERLKVMAPCELPWTGYAPLGIEAAMGFEPRYAEDIFLTRFRELWP